MFGSTSGTGLFGGQQQQHQQQQQQQQPAQSGGLFGGGQSQQGSNAGGGLFGSSSGAQPAGGGLFGSSGGSGNTGSGGGLFGSTGGTANAGGGGGLFGSTAANTGPGSGGGLFGGSNTATTNSGGGLFGNTSTNTTNSGGGLLGSSGSNSNNTGGGLFGGSSSNTGGGLFGSSSTGNTGGGLFGSSATSSGGGGGLFGQQQPQQQQQQQQQGGLFGQSQQPQQSQMFGQPQQGGFNMAGNSAMMGMQQQQQQQPAAAPWWYRELMSVQRAYQPGQGSRFQTMLYEVVGLAPDLLVNSSSIALSHVDSIKTQRKRRVLQDNPWIDEREWQRAEDNNPDPLNWMPTPVVGIEALNKRVEAQASHVREQLEMLTQPPTRGQILGKVQSQQQQQQQPQAPSGGLFGQPQTQEQQQQGQSAGQGNGQTAQEQQQLTTISESSDEAKEEVQNDGGKALWLNLEVGEPQEQIEQCRHEHMRLRHRLIKALGRLERLQSASARGGRSEAEIEFDQRLARLDGALSDPRGCRAQLTSIVTQMELENYQDSKLSLSDSRESGSSSFDNQEQEQMAIFSFLELQRDGIESLMKIVKRDMRDLEIIKRRTMAELPNRYN